MVFSKNDVRLMGLKSLGPQWELLPGLGINTTLTWRHKAGTYLVARQAQKILTRRGIRTSLPSCRRAGKIQSAPGLLYGENESSAHSTLRWVMILAATRQSTGVARWAAAGSTPPSPTSELGK